MSASRLRIAACTETSSADVGSSHTTRRGSPANARAMATRCFKPPDSWPGRTSISRSSNRTSCARRRTRSSRSARVAPSSFVTARPMIRRTEERRFNAVSGSWNTICTARTCPASRWPTRAPSGVPSSSRRDPASGAVRPSRIRASVVFPLPDSPTRPSVSPGRTSIETSDSALTRCPFWRNVFDISVNESTGRSGSAAPTAAADAPGGADVTGSDCARSW